MKSKTIDEVREEAEALKEVILHHMERTNNHHEGVTEAMEDLLHGLYEMEDSA